MKWTPHNIFITATNYEFQIEEWKKYNHENIWNMLDDEVFNGKTLQIKLEHFMKRLPRCICKQFIFYHQCHVFLDESQRYSVGLYSENFKN